MAAKKIGMTRIPVSYQDFASESEEYQFLTAHNMIAKQSQFDFHSFKVELEGLGDIDIDLFGLENFSTSHYLVFGCSS